MKVKSVEACPTDGSTFISNSTQNYCYPKEYETIENYNYVTQVFLSVYLLIGNVMLLNLLIAVFTSVFEEVHENSNEVWKWEMYRLVEEYDRKPGLAPPLVILEDIFKLLKVVWKKTCRQKRENRKIYTTEFFSNLNALNIFFQLIRI